MIENRKGLLPKGLASPLQKIQALVAPIAEAARKASEGMRMAFSEWPDIDVDEAEHAAANTWKHYSDLLQDAKNWTVLESHEKWLETQAIKARETAAEEHSEELRKRQYLYANIYETKRRTLLRLMHRYMATNSRPTWEEEKDAIEKEDARIKHVDNKQWVIDTYNALRGDHEDDKPKYEAVQREYLKEFKKSISTSTIRVYLGHKQP